jgi:hypothetical protein
MQPMDYIGPDVHKRKISYCVKDSSGKIHSEGSIPATRFDLDRWMMTLPQRWSAVLERRGITAERPTTMSTFGMQKKEDSDLRQESQGIAQKVREGGSRSAHFRLDNATAGGRLRPPSTRPPSRVDWSKDPFTSSKQEKLYATHQSFALPLHFVLGDDRLQCCRSERTTNRVRE